MKKIISLLLVGIMALSMIPTALATTDYTNGTQVSYNAEADNDGDGNPDHTEAWTVTVPALLAPGGNGDVVASGTWGSNRKLVVTADANVTLTNSINAADQKVLDVTFPGIELAGSNTAAVTDTKAVSVAAMPADALFGTWSGTFYYDVEMVDVVNNVEMITFTVTNGSKGTVTYQAEAGMTWREWIESDYNTSESPSDITIYEYDDTVTGEHVTTILCGGLVIDTPAVQSTDDVIIANTEYKQSLG